MRVYLTGGRSFGAYVLENILLSQRHEVHGVICPQQDKMWYTAQKLGIPRASRFPEHKEFNGIDLVVNAHGTTFITPEVRAATKLGAIGYHPSLLPRHRGRSAVEWTIKMEDVITGGTVYKMDEGYDTGPIVLQDWCHVRPEWRLGAIAGSPKYGASELWSNRLFPMGVRLLLDALDYIEDRVARKLAWSAPQDEVLATYEPPYKKG